LTLYADTSALARAYLPDEPEHRELRELLLAGEESVATSSLSRVEFSSTVRRARETGGLRLWQQTLERFDLDCESGGPLTLVELEGGAVILRACEIVLEHPLRALDAIHLAVALEERVDAFVTRDSRQAEAATALGLAVR